MPDGPIVGMLTAGIVTATFGSGMGRFIPPAADGGASGFPVLAEDPAGSRLGPLMIRVYWLSPSGSEDGGAETSS